MIDGCLCQTCVAHRVGANLAGILFIPMRPPSQNEHFGHAKFGFAAERKVWAKALIDAAQLVELPLATGPRRVVFTRVYTGREQVRDYGNMVGGMKLIVDAMQPTREKRITNGKRKGKLVTVIGAGIILDDSPAMLQDVYLQEHDKVLSGLRIAVYDLPDVGQMSLPSATVAAS